ncbi:UvrD-helicase domain-containing protein [Candidatus Amarolinea dominans]|uniref:UvrD-helicase domain-containing protein n=1 Tax=Candidatus Amarolinea dominans TaxID=3140696 RepID=UPI0031375D11|nr:UvrD-helicase domain-containing protein [Anaerolineae bacterium]
MSPEQRTAVTATAGHVLVLNWAGSSKTRSVDAPHAHLCGNAWPRPGRIMAVTFTNKAGARC